MLAVLLAGLAGVLSCGGDDAALTTASFIARIVLASDTSVKAVYVTGAAPAAAGGPTVNVTGPAVVINGGSVQADLQASGAFTTVVVTVDGRDGYYELTVPSAAVHQIIITMAAAIRGNAFIIDYGVGGGTNSLGAYDTTPVNVIQVGSGDIQVSVSWDAQSDVDLHLVLPDASEIYWANPTASNGTLDLDSNAGCSIDGVRNENITWPSATPPTGTYTVRVDYWDSCGVGATNYVVTVAVKNKAPLVFTGQFTGTGDGGGAGSGTTITTFTFP